MSFFKMYQDKLNVAQINVNVFFQNVLSQIKCSPNNFNSNVNVFFQNVLSQINFNLILIQMLMSFFKMY